MLESGVVLARKWGSPTSEKKWLKELQSSGATEKTLTSLAGKVKNVTVIEKSNVANFEHGFSFSETRW